MGIQYFSKSFAKTPKNYHFLAQLLQKWGPMGHAQNKKQNKNNFFAEKIKPDHKLSKKFYFIKISYALAEL